MGNKHSQPEQAKVPNSVRGLCPNRTQVLDNNACVTCEVRARDLRYVRPFIFCDLRRKRCASVSMTPHQCWKVCDWKTSERDQPCEAQLSLPTCTHREVRKKLSFRLWPSRFRKVARPPFDHLIFTKQGGTQMKRMITRFTRSTPCSKNENAPAWHERNGNHRYSNLLSINSCHYLYTTREMTVCATFHRTLQDSVFA